MQLAANDRRHAVASLFVGALGLGEQHETPDGRDLAIQLINARIVSHLFLELYGGAFQKMIDAAAADGHKVSITTRYQCSTTLSKVANTAIKRGVPVHCVDSKDGHMSRASKAAMIKRNRHAAERFTAITGAANAVDPKARGCLLLFGGAHFEEGYGLQNLIPRLPLVMAG